MQVAEECRKAGAPEVEIFLVESDQLSLCLLFAPCTSDTIISKFMRSVAESQQKGSDSFHLGVRQTDWMPAMLRA